VDEERPLSVASGAEDAVTFDVRMEMGLTRHYFHAFDDDQANSLLPTISSSSQGTDRLNLTEYGWAFHANSFFGC